jgi:hypothetical protein
VRKGKTLWLFDPVEVRRRRDWKTIQRILDWFDSAASADLNFTGLSFEEAARRADE